MPLPGGAAVAVATRRERAATLPCGAPLWRATCAVLLDPSDAAAPPDAARERYADLLRLALAEPGLYYSDEEDATRCEQDRHSNGTSTPNSDDKAGALSVRAPNAQRTLWHAA